jgi:hypothetical protein
MTKKTIHQTEPKGYEFGTKRIWEVHGQSKSNSAYSFDFWVVNFWTNCKTVTSELPETVTI